MLIIADMIDNVGKISVMIGGLVGLTLGARSMVLPPKAERKLELDNLSLQRFFRLRKGITVFSMMFMLTGISSIIASTLIEKPYAYKITPAILQIIGGILIGISFIYWGLFWRCPGCKRFMGTGPQNGKCRKCDAQLVPAKRN